MTTQELTLQFFLQLAVVLVICRLIGRLILHVGQPRVVGEMIAGILLGPSLLGLVAPSVQSALFPPESLGLIAVVSQLGLVLYMFAVGTHLETDVFAKSLRGAMLISVAGIVLPFVLGALLAWSLFQDGRFFSPDVPRLQGTLYLGVAMSVTAFPVLARIIQERGLAGSTLGTLVLAAGAVGDAIAWCMLAAVLAGFKEDMGLATTAIVGGLAYTIGVLVFLRPQLKKLGVAVEQYGSLSTGKLTILFVLVLSGAWFTDVIGVHAVFGAFVMGAAMPRGLLTRAIARQVEPLATVLLVPLFFTYSGLSTRFGLLWSRDLLLVALAVIVVASVGKGVACWAAARAAGRPNDESIAIGALMNARGLMELVMLNIGLERGLITETLFTVMVTMTIVTTLAAGPIFEWAARRSRQVPDGAPVPTR